VRRQAGPQVTDEGQGVEYLSDAQPLVDDVEVAGLLELAVDAARRAGALAESARRTGVDVAATKTNDLDVVTRADIDVENLIRETILTRRPQDGFLGEESEEVLGDDDLTWLVDPIDGTVNYLYGAPGYAVSIAAYRRGTPLVGVVYSPGLDELWAARRGGGATLNGLPVRTAGSVSPAQPLLATVFDYDPEARVRQMQRLADSAVIIRDVRVSGSTALDLCRVAAGRVDVFCTDSVHWWDVGAGIVIAREAGCKAWAHQDPASLHVSCVVSNPTVSDTVLSSLGYAVVPSR